MMKKTASLILAAVMIFTASIATAKTVEPESTETNGLAGVTVHATVGEYDMEPINAAVEKEVKKFLKRLASKPRETMKSEAFNLYTICAVLLMNLEHYSIRMLFKQLAIAILM